MKWNEWIKWNEWNEIKCKMYAIDAEQNINTEEAD